MIKKLFASPLDESQYCLSYNADEKQIPYFRDKNILVQTIVISAGNVFILFRTGKLCQEICRKISRYFLDNTYLLEISVCAVQRTDLYYADINSIYAKLDLVKNNYASAHPFLPPAIVKKEMNTGDPVFKIQDNGEPISRCTLFRRENINSMKSISCVKGPGGKPYVAVLHIDGNNMGSTISSIFPKARNYEEGVRFQRFVNRNIADAYANSLRKTLAYLKATYFLNMDDENLCWVCICLSGYSVIAEINIDQSKRESVGNALSSIRQIGIVNEFISGLVEISVERCPETRQVRQAFKLSDKKKYSRIDYTIEVMSPLCIYTPYEKESKTLSYVPGAEFLEHFQAIASNAEKKFWTSRD